jgi:transcriptional regulator with XRE-family HTH domain
MVKLTRLRIVRERAALNQRELAAKAGVTSVQISRIERGDVDPYASTIRKLATALGVPPTTLMGPEEGQNPSAEA